MTAIIKLCTMEDRTTMHMHSAIAVMSACLALLLLHVLGRHSTCFCFGSVETGALTGQG